MSRIFLGHSSADNAPAVALSDWLSREGWDDVFLDVDPDRGIAAGERRERALNEAASRCEGCRSGDRVRAARGRVNPDQIDA